MFYTAPCRKGAGAGTSEGSSAGSSAGLSRFMASYPVDNEAQCRKCRIFWAYAIENHGDGSPDHFQGSGISMLYYLSHSHFT